MLELMHFAEEMLDISEFRVPSTSAAGKKKMEMAKTLIASMSDTWDPEAWKDEYHEALEKVIDDKIKAGGKAAPSKAKPQRATNVIDLLSVLQQSVQSSKAAAKKPAAKKLNPARKTPTKKKAG